MRRIHLDTDLGSDPDDACALAMLLGWPGVELVGITTSADRHGQRAGYVEHCLRLVGRGDIPVAAGAAKSSTTGQHADPVIDDERHWPAGIPARPAPPGAALNLLTAGIDSGATVVAVGPYTNLAMLEAARPGSLGRTPVAVMGGWVDPPAEGLPPWGPARDFNVQWDTRAALTVASAATDLTLATLPATLRAHLRAADLPRLRACGPLGELLAAQSEAHAVDSGKGGLGARHEALPDDLLNFLYDPVACAIAAGWTGVRVRRRALRPVLADGVLRFADPPFNADPAQGSDGSGSAGGSAGGGRKVGVLEDLDGRAFTERFLAAVAAAHR